MSETRDESFFQRPWVKAAFAGVLVATGMAVYRGSQCTPKVTGENLVAFNVGLSIGEPRLLGAPACGTASADGPACMTALAAYMGSRTGFHADKPDQASCAAVAVALVRDHRGDLAPDSNAWQNQLKAGQGVGVDALRMAVAMEMARAASDVGQRADDEAAAKRLIAAVARSVPGACDTYAALAQGVALESMAPTLHPDHSACVQRDLARRDGPGGTYGSGVFRAAEGAAALWREEERALRMGVANASPGAKKRLTEALAVIEPKTAAISLKKVTSGEDQALNAILGDVHADAGVVLWKPDAGAAATSDAGASALGPRPR